jgi:hypothetical protein
LERLRRHPDSKRVVHSPAGVNCVISFQAQQSFRLSNKVGNLHGSIHPLIVTRYLLQRYSPELRGSGKRCDVVEQLHVLGKSIGKSEASGYLAGGKPAFRPLDRGGAATSPVRRDRQKAPRNGVAST